MSTSTALRKACYEDIERCARPAASGLRCQVSRCARAGTDRDRSHGRYGFTDLIGSVPASETSVDVLLHSPGGSPEATERIVGLLRKRFKSVAFVVPHSAYSAGTMLALSGDEIILHSSATLGPIDPQINGTPARSIRRGFDKVRELLKEQGPEALPAYIPLIEKHSLELLENCDDALKLSKELATEWLQEYMFAGNAESAEAIGKAVDYFSNYDEHKTHSRPLTLQKLAKFNLRITEAEPALGDLLREAYILISGFFAVTPFVKIYENSTGLSWGRQFQQIILPSPQQLIPPTA